MRFASCSTHFMLDDGSGKPVQHVNDAVITLHGIIRLYGEKRKPFEVNDALLGRFRCLLVLDIDNGHHCHVNDLALAQMQRLRCLNLSGDCHITDDGISTLTNLHSLVLRSHPCITDRGISCLTRLHKLVLTHNGRISDTGLESLSDNLRCLELVGHCPRVTDSGVAQLTQLTWLNLSLNPHIGDEALISLASANNMKHLVLFSNDRITDYGISRLATLDTLCVSYSPITEAGLACLTQLVTLEMFSTMPAITGGALARMTRLRQLSIPDVEHLDDTALSRMTYLHSLSLTRNPCISNQGLKPLTNLTQLSLRGNERITNEALLSLTGLRRLNLSQNYMITLSGIKHLTLLKQLNTYDSLQLNKVPVEQMHSLFPLLKNYAPYQSDKHGLEKDADVFIQ